MKQKLLTAIFLLISVIFFQPQGAFSDEPQEDPLRDDAGLHPVNDEESIGEVRTDSLVEFQPGTFVVIHPEPTIGKVHNDGFADLTTGTVMVTPSEEEERDLIPPVTLPPPQEENPPVIETKISPVVTSSTQESLWVHGGGCQMVSGFGLSSSPWVWLGFGSFLTALGRIRRSFGRS